MGSILPGAPEFNGLGQRGIPADQLDFVIGGLIALSLFVAVRSIDIALIVLMSFVGDIMVNQVSFRLGIRETKW
ncbi:MAG TPA: CDP-archaeol synthase [Casimicrobiaceae bacterium]